MGVPFIGIYQRRCKASYIFSGIILRGRMTYTMHKRLETHVKGVGCKRKEKKKEKKRKEEKREGKIN